MPKLKFLNKESDQGRKSKSQNNTGKKIAQEDEGDSAGSSSDSGDDAVDEMEVTKVDFIFLQVLLV